MKPVVHSFGSYEHPDLATFTPPDPFAVELILKIEVGSGKGRGTDSFYLRVATPKGLEALPVGDNLVIAAGNMLVLDRYDHDVIKEWIEQTVASCEADVWESCTELLAQRLHWEFDDGISRDDHARRGSARRTP